MSLRTTSWMTTPFVLYSPTNFARLSRSEFYEFCQLNSEVRIERTAEGDLDIMPPIGGETGRQSGEVFLQLAAWSKIDGTGIAFDSSTGFWLPNGAERSPDAAWVRRERWEALTQEERDEFPPLAPDFVVELRSKSERLTHLRAKMQEYADNGVRLGWLIDPATRSVEIYRPGQTPAIVENPSTLNADPELPGFTLDLATIW